jgi:hypothetical protein
MVAAMNLVYLEEELPGQFKLSDQSHSHLIPKLAE